MGKILSFWAFLLVCGEVPARAQAFQNERYTTMGAFAMRLSPQDGHFRSLSEGWQPLYYPGPGSCTPLVVPDTDRRITGSLMTDSATRQGFVPHERPLSFPALVIPAVGITYGVVALHDSAPFDLNHSTKNEIRQDHPFFVTHVDNFLQWSPAAAVVALNIAGVQGERPFGSELRIYGISTLLMGGSVFSLKHLTHEQRPDGSSFTSFPSGHTATVFAAAEWLRTEYWQRSPWIGMAGYAAATATGVLRVYNNRHWVSDVVAGAAIGFLSTRIAYAVDPWVEKHVFHGRRQVSR